MAFGLSSTRFTISTRPLGVGLAFWSSLMRLVGWWMFFVSHLRLLAPNRGDNLLKPHTLGSTGVGTSISSGAV
jgi:hypothetical protein